LVSGVEDPQDLVELDRLVDLGLGQRRVLGQGRHPGRSGRELDVGLPEQRRLAQDGLGVGGDRGVLLLELDLGQRAGAALVEVLGLDLAHVDPRDPHVGLGDQVRTVGERELEAVALRLQGQLAAEGQPQEEADREDRQGEERHREDASGIVARGASLLDGLTDLAS
jgi:hypothetical protein